MLVINLEKYSRNIPSLIAKKEIDDSSIWEDIIILPLNLIYKLDYEKNDILRVNKKYFQVKYVDENVLLLLYFKGIKYKWIIYVDKNIQNANASITDRFTAIETL